MQSRPWHQSKWPKGVSHEISGYDKPLFSFLDNSARDYSDLTYTIYSNAKRTYRQVKDAADRVANFLASNGIKKGDRVAIFLPNLPHYPSIFFGILKAGAVCVTCNPLYTPDELNFQLKDCGARAVFCMDHPQFYPTTVKAIKGTDVKTVIICGVKAFLPRVKAFMGSLLNKIPKADEYVPGHLFFDDIIKKYSPKLPQVNLDPSKDPAIIIYTGGTTGRPKGAVLTHSSLVFLVNTLDEYARISQLPGHKPEKMRRGGFNCLLGVLPWYHSFGMTTCMLWSCRTGNKLVCIPDPRAGDPPFTDVLQAIEKHKVTIASAVPTIFVAMTNHSNVDKFDLTSLIACPSGGAPLAVESAKRFEAKTGAVIFEGYGLSETSGIACVNPTNLEDRKFGSVGFPLCNTDVKIVDIATGLEELVQGEDGEIAISGPQIMKEYWNKPEANKEVFRELAGQRYFLTGDIGHIDEEGYIIITDRKKDMILVGGFNVYPADVEEVIFTHPKVAMTAVIGVPDSKGGEKVKAFVTLIPGGKATEQEILDFCKEKLTGYKRPREIEFRDQLPTSIIGKVLRRVLRDEEAEKK